MRLVRFWHRLLRLCGIGTVFLTLPAVAKIVYTPVNVTIVKNGSIKIDLNHDGIVDFTIASNAGAFPCTGTTVTRFAGLDTLFPATGNSVVGAPVAPLASGTLVGTSDTFQTQSVIDSFSYAVVISTQPPRFCFSYSHGWCPNPGFAGTCSRTAYMGLAFKINGQIHYGWAELSIKVARGVFDTTLIGFAYETVAGQAIATGATSGG